MGLQNPETVGGKGQVVGLRKRNVSDSKILAKNKSEVADIPGLSEGGFFSASQVRRF